MKIIQRASFVFAIGLLALILWCFNAVGSNTDLREKLIASVLGAAISGFLVVSGWIITFQNNIKQQALNSENQNYEKVVSKIIDKISAYMQWMYDLEGRLQSLKEKAASSNIASIVVDWDKFTEYFSNIA